MPVADSITTVKGATCRSMKYETILSQKEVTVDCVHTSWFLDTIFHHTVLRGAISDFALKPTLKVFGKCGLWVCCNMPRRMLPSALINHARQGFLIPQISDSIVLRRVDICTRQDFVLITVESRLHWCWRALSGFRSVISSILIFFTGRWSINRKFNRSGVK